MNENSDLLLRMAARDRGALLRLPLVLVAVIALPLWAGWAVVAANIAYGMIISSRRRKELKPVIAAIGEFMNLGQGMTCIRRAEAGERSVTLSERIAQAAADMLEEGAKAENCFEGHQLGCRHHKIQVQEQWPDILKKEVNRVLDPRVA